MTASAGPLSGAEAPRLAIVEAGAAVAAGRLFGGLERIVVTSAELRPETPFAGALFEVLGARAPGEIVALAVSGVWCGGAAGDGPPTSGPSTTGPSASGARRLADAPAVLVVRDHVNLALRGPLTGRWPSGVPRSFPCMTGIYQPSAARVAAGAPVYSGDVVAAGVRDAARLTPFERRALDEAGAAAYADCLVPAVVAAAFYGLKVAACLVAQAAHERE